MSDLTHQIAAIAADAARFAEEAEDFQNIDELGDLDEATPTAIVGLVSATLSVGLELRALRLELSRIALVYFHVMEKGSEGSTWCGEAACTFCPGNPFREAALQESFREAAAESQGGGTL